MTTKAEIVELLKTNDRAVIRALVVLNERQTADEQVVQDTKYRNGRGFRPCHARMGTSMAKFFSRNGYLTAKQIAYWRAAMSGGKMRIEIYAGQLLEEANAKAAKATAQALAPITPASKAPVNPYIGQDVGNLLEQKMVLEEELGMLIDSDDPNLIDPVSNCISLISDALAQEGAQEEREMQQMEAQADRAGAQRDELLKYWARKKMEKA